MRNWIKFRGNVIQWILSSNSYFELILTVNFTLYRKPWTKFVNNFNKKYMSNESLDFVDRLLRYDHAKRLTPREAMAHSYFKPIREYHEQKKSEMAHLEPKKYAQQMKEEEQREQKLKGKQMAKRDENAKEDVDPPPYDDKKDASKDENGKATSVSDVNMKDVVMKEQNE